MKNDNQSLSHTKWNCKYHIVFAPKYRRQAIYGKVREDIGKILRQLCELKNVDLIEGRGTVPRSCTSACEYSAKSKCITLSDT